MIAFWRTPFYVLIGAVVILAIANGSRQNFGLFLVPLSADLGWGRTEFSFAIAVQNLVLGLGAPFIAAIADKWGLIRVMAITGVIYAAGVWLISVSTTPELMLLNAGLVVGLGAAGIGFSLPLALVGRVASETQRSLWLGITTAGASAGQFMFAPLSQGLISGYGWSQGMVIVSVIVAITIPLSLSLRAGSAETLVRQTPQSLSQALAEASGHRGYWLLVTGFFVCGFQVQFIATHLPGFITDAGGAPWLPAGALATIGLFNLAGTLGSGWLGGRFSKKYLLSLLYLMRAVLFLVFLQFPVTETSVLIFSAVLGVLWLSTVPLTSGIVAQVFGARYMATLFSIVLLGHQLGSFCGVWLGGLFYDRTGSYDATWWLAIVLGVAAALIHWPINDKPIEREVAQPT
ncbi:MAG: MFS transporter [Rhodospirillales bacterium]|nr:MFS transporter [Rhodospirillales bacterium]